MYATINKTVQKYVNCPLPSQLRPSDYRFQPMTKFHELPMITNVAKTSYKRTYPVESTIHLAAQSCRNTTQNITNKFTPMKPNEREHHRKLVNGLRKVYKGRRVQTRFRLQCLKFKT